MEADSIYPEVIADRYELRELISRGGMSTVFRCIDKVINSDCAIKLLSLEEILSRKGRERFEQECQMLLHFDHPNVIHNLDYGIFDDIPYLVMELCVDKQGRPFTLRQYQQQCENGRITWEDLRDVFAQFVRGLSLFHQHGLVHRDIKPDNVLLHLGSDDRLMPKIIDFGLVAVSCDADMGQRMQLSTPVEQQPLNSNEIKGTLKFMSPEQLDGSPVSASSDIYSLGVTLFNLMTDEDHPNVAPKAWSQTDAPDWLTELLFATLQEDPSMRPKDAMAVWEYFPKELQELASTQEELDRDAPTKHQVKLSANTIILGDPIQGRFQVLEETGQHSGVSWFSCRDLNSGDMLSIRLVPYDRERDQEHVDNFEHRCRELMKLDHPNLIKIIECGVDTMLGQAYLVTELIPDGESGPMTLKDLIRSKPDKRLNWREVCHFTPQITGALSELHRNGVTHGQLSPRNVLLTKGDGGLPIIKLMGYADCEIYDENVIRYLPEFSGRRSAFGRPGGEAGIVCDYDFMAPEQRLGDPYDPQTDAYSLGRVLYNMATGYERFSVSKPTEINPELPGWVDDLCEHCLEEDRNRRIESVLLAEHLIPEEVRDGEKNFLEDDGEQTEPESPPVPEPVEPGPKLKTKKAFVISDIPKAEPEPLDTADGLSTTLDPFVHDDVEEHTASRTRPEIGESNDDVPNTLSISLKQQEDAAVGEPPVRPKTLGIRRPPPKASAIHEETVEDEPEAAPQPRRVELPKLSEAARPKAVPTAAAMPEPEPVPVEKPRPSLRVIGDSAALVPLKRPAEPIRLKSRRRRRSWFRQWRRRYKRSGPVLVVMGGMLVSLLVCLFLYGSFKALFSGSDGDVQNAFYVNCQRAEEHLKRHNYSAARRCAENAQQCARDAIDQQKKALELLKRIRRESKEYEKERKALDTEDKRPKTGGANRKVTPVGTVPEAGSGSTPTAEGALND